MPQSIHRSRNKNCICLEFWCCDLWGNVVISVFFLNLLRPIPKILNFCITVRIFFTVTKQYEIFVIYLYWLFERWKLAIICVHFVVEKNRKNSSECPSFWIVQSLYRYYMHKLLRLVLKAVWVIGFLYSTKYFFAIAFIWLTLLLLPILRYNGGFFFHECTHDFSYKYKRILNLNWLLAHSAWK